MTTIGLLHPGAMGASVGACLRAAGHDVLWCSAGRGAATAERAKAADLRECEALDALVEASDVLFSVCPPAEAARVAAACLDRSFRGTYVDANAIAPGTSRQIAAQVAKAGAHFVDGGIIGPPANEQRNTHLVLSASDGQDARSIAALFEGTNLRTDLIDGGPGHASALKMAFAAWTKGQTALLLAVRAVARSEGVEEALLGQWSRTHPELGPRSEGMARLTAPKAWRFVGEMHEISKTFEEAGTTGNFHRGAADVYAALEAFKDRDDASLDDVLNQLVR